MSSKRLRLVLLGSLFALALLFVATMVVGLSLLNKKSQRMVSLKVETKSLEAQLGSLGQAKKEIEQYSYFKGVAKSVIPDDKDQAQAVVDIIRLARESGISIQTITFPSSDLGEAPKNVPASGASGTAASGAAPAATSTAAQAISQAKPVPGIKGLYSLELTIAPEIGTQLPPAQQVTYPKMIDFLKRIERNRRTAQITQVNIQPLTPGTVVSDFINFTLVINIFIKP